jgi:hypothetical protein
MRGGRLSDTADQGRATTQHGRPDRQEQHSNLPVCVRRAGGLEFAHAHGEYLLRDPIAHLNGLTARCSIPDEKPRPDVRRVTGAPGSGVCSDLSGKRATPSLTRRADTSPGWPRQLRSDLVVPKEEARLTGVMKPGFALQRGNGDEG